MKNIKRMVVVAAMFLLTANVFGQSLRDELVAAAENGRTTSSYLLGRDAYGKGNYEEAVKWFRKAAEQGDASSQALLGNCYYYGKGVKQDYEEAVKWYRKVAEEHAEDAADWGVIASAQYALSVCYYEGKGVEKNHDQAIKWCLDAAENFKKFKELEKVFMDVMGRMGAKIEGNEMVVPVNSPNVDTIPKFMGIPIECTKTEMINKLKAKGFTYNQQKDCLTGEFNGRNVKIVVQTQRNKVWRIVVEYFTTKSQQDMINEYNNLCRQFDSNDKYTYKYGEQLSEDEWLEFHLTMQDKSYQAAWKSDDGAFVWMNIQRDYPNNCLLLFYENPNNEAKGEDL